MGCLGIALAAASAIAQSTLPLHSEWDPPQTEDFIGLDLEPVPFGEDQAVDRAVWYDEENETTWVYVLGVMTNDAGAKIFGIYRYDIDNPAVNNKIWYPTTNYLTTTVNHRPEAMAIDGATGNVFCAGSIYDAQERDYLTVCFNPSLSGLNTGWSTDGVEIFNGDGDDEDFAKDVTLYDLGDNKRVVVTGTSTDAENGTDIVTIAYYTDAGQTRQTGETWIDWKDALNNVDENGNETATELAVCDFVEDQQVGVGVAVAGTSDSGDDGLDMIVCLYRPGDALTPIRHWSTPGYRLYNGPADGDDVCTGLAAVAGLSQPSAYTLCLCGKTPKYPPYTDDTEYLVWAVGSGNGADYWPGGTYFGGRAWSPGADESGADAAYDVVYGSPDAQTVWITGECEFNGTWDVGTISYQVTGVDAGDLNTQHVYDSPAADGRDDRARAITASSVGIFVTGWTEGYATPSVLTLQYAQSDGQPDAVGRYRNTYYARGAGLFHVTFVTESEALIVIGTTVSNPSYGLAWLVARYEP